MSDIGELVFVDTDGRKAYYELCCQSTELSGKDDSELMVCLTDDKGKKAEIPYDLFDRIVLRFLYDKYDMTAQDVGGFPVKFLNNKN